MNANRPKPMMIISKMPLLLIFPKAVIFYFIFYYFFSLSLSTPAAFGSLPARFSDPWRTVRSGYAAHSRMENAYKINKKLANDGINCRQFAFVAPFLCFLTTKIGHNAGSDRAFFLFFLSRFACHDTNVLAATRVFLPRCDPHAGRGAYSSATWRRTTSILVMVFLTILKWYLPTFTTSLSLGKLW